MSLVDLLVTILVATILITVGIGLMTYLVYKLRYARVRDDEREAGGEDGRYFVPYDPPGEDEGSEIAPEDASAPEPGDPAAGVDPSGEARGS